MELLNRFSHLCKALKYTKYKSCSLLVHSVKCVLNLINCLSVAKITEINNLESNKVSAVTAL